MILQLLDLASAAVVLVVAVRNVNAMSAATSHVIRTVYIVLAVGAMWMIGAGVVDPRTPTVASVLGHSAIAALMLVDRRRHSERREVVRT